MIVTTQTNSNPYVLTSGMAIRQNAPVIPAIPPDETKDFCNCLYECKYVEPVFASDNGNWWENDKNTFIYQKLLTSDIINIKLYKNNVFLADITENTYGEYRDDWDLEIGRKYITFIIDWRLVFDTEGYGTYRVEAEKTIIGRDSTEVSHDFQLRFYRDELANGTIRIESYQNGNILRSPFDYTGMNLYRSSRIHGQLNKLTPKVTIDKYEDTSRIFNQIQDRITDQFDLETQVLPRQLAEHLVYDGLLSNEFLVTDYNRFNDVARRTSLYLEEITERIKPNQQTGSAYMIKFNDRKDDQLKRNF